MALLIWLPLTKDLHNLGLNDVTITNNGVTYSSTGGKLGGTFVFDSTSRCALNKYPLSGKSQATVTFWINPSSSSFQAFMIGYSGGYWQLGFLNSAIRLRDNKNGYNGSRFDKTLTTIPTSTWTHIAITYNSGTVIAYINGTVDKTYSTGGTSLCSMNYAYIGNDYYNSGYGANCSINDFRIYDNCLSSLEIKDISKGIILKIPGNDTYILNTTNKFACPTPGSSNVNSYAWDKTLHANSIAVSGWNSGYNGGVGNPTTIYHAHWILMEGLPTMRFPYITNSSGLTPGWLGIAGGRLVASDFTSGTQYTVSFDAKSDTNGMGISCGLYYKKTSDGSLAFWDGIKTTSLTTQWKRYSITYTSYGAYSIGNFYFYGLCSGTKGNKYVRNIQLELGDTATFYKKSTRTSICYDTSGLHNDLTVNGTITLSSDTKRYDKSCYLANLNISTNYLSANDWSPSFITNGSLSFWCKFNGISSNGWLPFAGLDGSHYIMATTSGTGGFYHRNAGSPTIYINGSSTTKPGTNTEWNHYVIKGINLSSWTSFKINNYSNTGTWNSNMYISDVRLYATALSVDDILELYKLGN